MLVEKRQADGVRQGKKRKAKGNLKSFDNLKKKNKDEKNKESKKKKKMKKKTMKKKGEGKDYTAKKEEKMCEKEIVKSRVDGEVEKPRRQSKKRKRGHSDESDGCDGGTNSKLDSQKRSQDVSNVYDGDKVERVGAPNNHARVRSRFVSLMLYFDLLMQTWFTAFRR